MSKILKKLNHIEDREILKKIYLYEEGIFGNSAVGQYNIVPFSKYGSCYAIYDEENIISVIEVLYSLNKVAYLYGVSTNEKFRNKGYAKKLLNFVLEDLKLKGIKKIELTVAPENYIAYKLYTNLGFKVIEKIEDEYFDGESRYIMRLE